MSRKIQTAIVGLGNRAGPLVQGIACCLALGDDETVRAKMRAFPDRRGGA